MNSAIVNCRQADIDSECSLEAQVFVAPVKLREEVPVRLFGTDATVDGETFPAKAACLRNTRIIWQTLLNSFLNLDKLTLALVCRTPLMPLINLVLLN